MGIGPGGIIGAKRSTIKEETIEESFKMTTSRPKQSYIKNSTKRVIDAVDFKETP